MDAGADRQVDPAPDRAQVPRRVHGATRSVEHGEGAVSRPLDDSPAVPPDRLGRDALVFVEQSPPPGVPEPSRRRRRPGHVGEEHAGERSVRPFRRADVRRPNEALDLVTGRVDGRSVPRDVTVERELDETGVSELRGQPPRPVDGERDVSGVVHDQGGLGDQRQRRPSVDVGPQAELLGHQPRARDVALPPTEQRLGARGCIRDDETPERPVAPRLRHPFDDPVRGVLRPSERIVVVTVEPGAGGVEHEGRHPVRGRRREGHRDRPPVRGPDEDGSVDVAGVHHRPEVVDLLLHGTETRAVREPESALVEHDQPGEGRQPLHERAVERDLLVEVEMCHRAGNQHDVDRALAVGGVGDLQPVALRVAHDCRRHVHE